ncbi:MAG: M20/M25/M40 family metallo-hydrolase [Candidatus Kapabacteria bacterium]|nr:M20/M25/M40 family metallo-hydrolase [Candidatus Kapabacteria bacterium]
MIELLQRLIATRSFSREENVTADILEDHLRGCGRPVQRFGNNVLSLPEPDGRPIWLLNSHHDTVRPGGGWSHDPLVPTIVDGRLYGLGSNDAGGALVMMLAAYLHMSEKSDTPVQFAFAATAEEEVSGDGGMALLAREVFDKYPLACALVGEPTQMQMAVAERGLMVLDCTWHGRTGHAARKEGINAIYAALADIEWFRTFEFTDITGDLGEVSMTVTQINAGTQHNVVPDVCTAVVDVRVPGSHTHEDVLAVIRAHVSCDCQPRSMRLRSSSIAMDHPLVQSGLALGMKAYASPTMSDQALLPSGVPSLKIGPGNSARSHTPDEWIGIDEVESGIATFIHLLETTMRSLQ